MAEEQNQEIEEQVQEPHGEEPVEIDWKAEARKWEGRAKENSERIKTMSQEHFEQMNEALKNFEENALKVKELQERAEKAEQEAISLRHKQDLAEWASAAAAEHGIPASILRGETAEEFMQHAAAIKSSMNVAPVVRDSGEPKKPPKSSMSVFNDFMNANFN